MRGIRCFQNPLKALGHPDGLPGAVHTAATRKVGTQQPVRGAWLRKSSEAASRDLEAPGNAPGGPQSWVWPLLPERSLGGWAGLPLRSPCCHHCAAGQLQSPLPLPSPPPFPLPFSCKCMESQPWGLGKVVVGFPLQRS